MNQRELFLRYVAQTSDAPLAFEVESAKGVWLYGPDGKKTMDVISGIAVSNIGHSHPEVLKAVHEQADRYMHLMVYGEVVQAPQVQLAAFLSSHLPSGLDNVYFVNSGSEAVEGALKLAKRYTGRYEIVSFKNAYHGSTQGALSIIGDECMKNNFRPLIPGGKTIAYNDIASLNEITENTACVIIESVQGEGGAIVPDVAYMKALRERCNETGALLIMDEIQAGCGRTGKLWAFEHFGIVPDILLLAKALGGGMPLGAFIASKEIMHCLTHHPVLGHITTFGGHPVCCAAALANLNVIIREKLWEQAAIKEQWFRDALKHPEIKNISGIGLMLAV
ncbi:MAG: aspartate aminotransferase family protein, partial [Bacteroidales bacterium]|nr:aspartate aminotransferase family protein [Bacteroidales bacterium]